MRLRDILILGFTAVILVQQTPAQDVPHTRVRLLADAKGIVPGRQFTAGVFMNIDQGWHTYWKNPGEAGLATKVTWTLPDGFRAGDILWPVPHKYIEEGDVLTYGYQEENMLLIPVTAPSNLKAGTRVVLKAKVEWLECERICVPRDVTVNLTLPVIAGNPPPDNEKLFASFKKKVPAAFDSTGGVRLAINAEKGTVELRLEAKEFGQFVVQHDHVADFYPEDLPGILIGRTKVQATIGGAILHVPLSASQGVNGPRTLRGVLEYTLTGKTTVAATLEIPLSAEFCAGLNAGPSGGGTTSLLNRTFNTAGGTTSGSNVFLYIVFALVGGLLLNVMPCVLPVIALKVFGLVRLAGDHPARIKKLGLAFSAGILASFLMLALLVIVLQAAGDQVGWGFQFQEPRFVVAMAAIVFAFGLSLFGVYEIMLPGSAVNAVGALLSRPSEGKTGYGASFGEGVFATILATPCTAPFLGSALGFAFSQTWPVILLIFTFVAIGMALPYLLLTMQPRWIRFLPKPGEWMVTAKQVMGFLMMATMLWLLFILGSQLGMEAVVWTGAFLLTVGFACWLVGRFATLTASTTKRRTTWIAALVIIVAGYFLFLGSILDIDTAVAVASSNETSVADPSGRIKWEPFSLSTLEADLQTGRPVFVDFTAEWCLTCKVNEKTVLNSDAIASKFRELNVLAVKADWTNRNPDITKLLAKFGRSGVPLYVVFPPGRPDSPVVLPELVTTGIVLDALQKATGG